MLVTTKPNRKRGPDRQERSLGITEADITYASDLIPEWVNEGSCAETAYILGIKARRMGQSNAPDPDMGGAFYGDVCAGFRIVPR